MRRATGARAARGKSEPDPHHAPSAAVLRTYGKVPDAVSRQRRDTLRTAISTYLAALPRRPLLDSWAEEEGAA